MFCFKVMNGFLLLIIHRWAPVLAVSLHGLMANGRMPTSKTTRSSTRTCATSRPTLSNVWWMIKLCLTIRAGSSSTLGLNGIVLKTKQFPLKFNWFNGFVFVAIVEMISIPAWRWRNEASTSWSFNWEPRHRRRTIKVCVRTRNSRRRRGSLKEESQCSLRRRAPFPENTRAWSLTLLDFVPNCIRIAAILSACFTASPIATISAKSMKVRRHLSISRWFHSDVPAATIVNG